ncbi:MAG: PBP1A family penicillin-binding protein [Coriobacteriia bacterium]|nr:PBP1A family penicillin-binding protein [Coriobacteriia bacterium]
MQRQEQGRSLRQVLVKILAVTSGILAVVALLSLGLSLYLWQLSGRLPDMQADLGRLQMAETSIVYAADGTVLAEWYDEQDRTVVASDVLPADLKQAVVAIEDRRFYEHDGVDLQAIVRALTVNTQAGEVRQGGSTITQQTVKLLFTDGERTLGRKIEEALMALSLEARADKEDVLGLYLNTVYFGRGAYGAQSAAHRFFGIPVQDLTLSQCALLAGCVQSPTRFDPVVSPAAALERRNVVLREMRDQGYVSSEEAAHALADPLGLKEADPAPVFAPYFVEYVRRDLLERLGSETLYRGGLRIYTTLDPDAQRAAEAAAAKVLPDADDPEVALAAVRWSDGSVVAIVGGRDFSAEQFDLATQGRRQTGSAFKPFVLAAALEDGYTLDSKWDASPFSTQVKDEIWHVENYENGITGGSYTLEVATVWSINTVYARLIMAVGADKVVDVAERMGITTPIDPDPAIALGGLKRGVSPLEMASAFGTIANKGMAVVPSGVYRVTDDEGELIYAPERSGSQAISEDVASAVAGVLNQVYSSGTGSGANTGQWGAVKTGTAQSWRDAWIVGYSGDISTAVWVGYPDAQIAMTDVHGIRVTGGSFPAQVWKRFMTVAAKTPERSPETTDGDGAAEFAVPQEVYTLCSQSLKIARPDCPDPMELSLPAGAIDDELCTLQH